MEGNRRGFSLLELMIAVVVIAALTGGALQYYFNSLEDAKRAKAKLDCDTLARAINKYEQIENVELTSLAELKGNHVANLDALRDPWGRPYAVDVSRGTVLSFGPDGKHAFGDPRNAANADDVEIAYSPGLMLRGARLEAIPPPSGEPVFWPRSSLLRLIFTKRVKAVRDIDFNADIAGGRHTTFLPTILENGQADPGCPLFAFRLYLDDPKRPLDAQAQIKPFYAHFLTTKETEFIQYPCGPVYLTPFVWSGRVTREEWLATCEAHGRDPEKPQDFGMIYASANLCELVVVLPDLAASAFSTGRYLINLTGTRRNADDGRGHPIFHAADGTLGAQMSPDPLRIEVQ